MRPARKKPKKCVKRKNRKKKRASKKKGWFSCGINTPDMETTNRALYIYKSQRTEGKGSWKVLPKDSVEVYKDRHRRNKNRRRKESQDDSSDDSTPDSRGDDVESSGKHVCK